MSSIGISINNVLRAVYVRNNFIRLLLKAYNCIVFTDFQPMKYSPFETLNLGFILKPFLKFRVKFQPRCYKTYSYTKKNLRTKLVRN